MPAPLSRRSFIFPGVALLRLPDVGASRSDRPRLTKASVSRGPADVLRSAISIIGSRVDIPKDAFRFGTRSVVWSLPFGVAFGIAFHMFFGRILPAPREGADAPFRRKLLRRSFLFKLRNLLIHLGVGVGLAGYGGMKVANANYQGLLFRADERRKEFLRENPESASMLGRLESHADENPEIFAALEKVYAREDRSFLRKESVLEAELFLQSVAWIPVETRRLPKETSHFLAQRVLADLG